MTAQQESSALRAFLDAFAEQYGTLRNLPRDEWPQMPPAVASRVDQPSEIKRGFALVDDAARKFAPWGLRPYPDPAHQAARSYLEQIDLINDHDTALHAEGLLQAARAAVRGGYSGMVVGCAREAATYAAEIEDLEGIDNGEAIAAAARAAGQTLASAALAAGEPEQAIVEAFAIAERLR